MFDPAYMETIAVPRSGLRRVAAITRRAAPSDINDITDIISTLLRRFSTRLSLSEQFPAKAAVCRLTRSVFHQIASFFRIFAGRSQSGWTGHNGTYMELYPP
jgi:hypothetical protein